MPFFKFHIVRRRGFGRDRLTAAKPIGGGLLGDGAQRPFNVVRRRFVSTVVGLDSYSLIYSVLWSHSLTTALPLGLALPVPRTSGPSLIQRDTRRKMGTSACIVYQQARMRSWRTSSRLGQNRMVNSQAACRSCAPVVSKAQLLPGVASSTGAVAAGGETLWGPTSPNPSLQPCAGRT